MAYLLIALGAILVVVAAPLLLVDQRQKAGSQRGEEDFWQHLEARLAGLMEKCSPTPQQADSHTGEGFFTAMADLNLTWQEEEIQKAVQLWEQGMSLPEMAGHLRGSGEDHQYEVAILLMDLARQGEVGLRPGGLWSAGEFGPPAQITSQQPRPVPSFEQMVRQEGGGPLFSAVYRGADQGKDVVQLARELQRGKGEIALILGLRNYRSAGGKRSP